MCKMHVPGNAAGQIKSLLYLKEPLKNSVGLRFQEVAQAVRGELWGAWSRLEAGKAGEAFAFVGAFN